MRPRNVNKALPLETAGFISELRSLYDEGWATEYIDDHCFRVADDVERVCSLVDSGDILNVGGAPYLFEFLTSKKLAGRRAVSLDLDPGRHADVIRQAGLHIRKCDIESGHDRSGFDFSRFSLIAVCEVFEHLRMDLIGTFSDVYSGMRDGALLYLTTPNFHYIMTLWSVYRGRSGPPPVEEWSKLSTLGHMGHIREYSKDEVVTFLEHIGFDVVEVTFRNSRPIPISRHPLKAPVSLTFRALAENVPSFAQEMVVVARKHARSK